MKYCYIRVSTTDQEYSRQLQIFKDRGYIDGENCKYVALFNTDDEEREISFDITDISIGGVKYGVWDMWAHEEYTVTDGVFSAKVNSHGARLFKITIK